MKSTRDKLEAYKLTVGGAVVDVGIFKDDAEAVPVYEISILNISETTKILLKKLREEFISRVNVGAISLSEEGGASDIKEKFKDEILILIKKYFPDVDDRTSDLLVTHVVQQNVGLGNIEILLKDPGLEEIVINGSKEPVWVYHKKYGWLKTNVNIEDEDTIRHYSTIIGRDVGKEITLLKPLMDAHLQTGDRINATLSPISTTGHTITIRKFSERPWTVTDMLKENTMSYETAAWVWLAIQNELSMIISGGTGSGKTSMLNAIANFFPPSQRIISIEDTRELTLPKILHWVPLETRLPNPEGKGEVTMLDLVVNSLRMRPDRIIMGEIRRAREAEVLFEAMHTGHSVYGTMHANNASETIIRLTNPPINVPKQVIGSLSLILVQNRNRRTGFRRTLQFAEVTSGGEIRVLQQYDSHQDTMRNIAAPVRLNETIELFTGMSPREIQKDIQEKVRILKWLVEENIIDVHKIGLIMAKYYKGTLRL